MANDNGYPRRILMVLLFVSSGFGGVPGGVKKSGLEPSRAQGPLPRVCEAILDPKQADRVVQRRDLGMARRSARRCWGDLGGLKYLHFSCNFGGRRVIQHARHLVYDKGRRIAPRIPPGQAEC